MDIVDKPFRVALSIALIISLTMFVPAQALASNDANSGTESELQSSLGVPRITSINIDSDYERIQTRNSGYLSGKKEYAKADRVLASWQKKCKVNVIFTDANDGSGVQYYIQRSTNSQSGFVTIKEGDSECSDYFKNNGANKVISDIVPKSATVYYRVVASCSYYDSSLNRDVAQEAISNVASVKTTPKELSIKSVKVKYGKKWKSRALIKNKNRYAYKGSHKYKISWKKRTDVDGYYVYQYKTRRKTLSKVKSYEYVTSTNGITFMGGPGYFRVNAKKYLKKVKILSKNASSYTFTCKDKNFKNQFSNSNYVVVPYVKNNGKITLGNANKTFYVYIGEVATKKANGGYVSTPKDKMYVMPNTLEYENEIPFPIK